MLTPVLHHPWDLSPKEAIALQQELRSRFQVCAPPADVHSVAGIDVSIQGDLALAGVVMMSFPDLAILEVQRAQAHVTFPYVPGLLSFREVPVILQALASLQLTPDVLMCDAQGYAHPRRLGLATHLGILLDHPSIGCAKSRLCGTSSEPGQERGEQALLYCDDEIIGAVVRTRRAVRPVYISVGHRYMLDAAVSLTLACARRYRLPEPTRWAHHIAGGKGPRP